MKSALSATEAATGLPHMVKTVEGVGVCVSIKLSALLVLPHCSKGSQHVWGREITIGGTDSPQQGCEKTSVRPDRLPGLQSEIQRRTHARKDHPCVPRANKEQLKRFPRLLRRNRFPRQLACVFKIRSTRSIHSMHGRDLERQKQ